MESVCPRPHITTDLWFYKEGNLFKLRAWIVNKHSNLGAAIDFFHQLQKVIFPHDI